MTFHFIGRSHFHHTEYQLKESDQIKTYQMFNRCSYVQPAAQAKVFCGPV